MKTLPNDPLLGRTLAGRFELLALIGTGAMGKVYQARHLGLDKLVAIKVLHAPQDPSDRPARRFKREAKAASRLDHPNSIRVLDFGEDHGLFYLAMEFLDGRDLQAVLRTEGQLGTFRTCWIMAQVAGALSAAHDVEVIHRDLKPGNIMLLDRTIEGGGLRDFVKVCDFGLAKILDPDAQPTHGPLTRQGAVFGTPAYMSPEQALGEPLDARSDIYACGAVLFRMLTGKNPFRGETATVVLKKHVQDPVPPMVDVDVRLQRIVLTCMAKTPVDRFRSARALRDALREILTERGIDIPSADAQPASPPVDLRQMDARASRDRVAEEFADTALVDTLSSVQPTPQLMASAPSFDATFDAPRTSDELVRAVGPAAPWWAWAPGALALILAAVLGIYLMWGP